MHSYSVSVIHRRKSRADGGGRSPQNLEWGTLIQIVPVDYYDVTSSYAYVWPGGVMVKALACDSRGRDEIAPHLGGQIPQKPPFLGRE